MSYPLLKLFLTVFFKVNVWSQKVSGKKLIVWLPMPNFVAIIFEAQVLNNVLISLGLTEDLSGILNAEVSLLKTLPGCMPQNLSAGPQL
jgi:hypothetical protein